MSCNSSNFCVIQKAHAYLGTAAPAELQRAAQVEAAPVRELEGREGRLRHLESERGTGQSLLGVVLDQRWKNKLVQRTAAIIQEALARLAGPVMRTAVRHVRVQALCNPHHGLLNHAVYLHDLCNPEIQCRTHKFPLIIPVLNRINPIPRIDTYFFTVHSNIVVPSTLRPS